MRALSANDGDLRLVDLLEAQYIAAHALPPSCLVSCMSSTERRGGCSIPTPGLRLYDTTRGLPQGRPRAVKLEWKGVTDPLPLSPASLSFAVCAQTPLYGPARHHLRRARTCHCANAMR